MMNSTEPRYVNFLTGFGAGVLIAVRFWLQWLMEITTGEARIHYLALQPIQWIITHTSGPLNQPPFHLLVLNNWLRILPPFSRLAHAGYGILITFLSLAVFYFWGRLFFSRKKSLLLVVILAWNPFHFLYSSGFQIYSLFLLSTAAAGYYSTKIIVFEDYDLYNWVGWAAAALFAVYTHSFALAYIVLLAGLLVWEVRRRPELSDCLLAIGAVLIAYLPWLLHTGASRQPAGLERWLQTDLVLDNFLANGNYFSVATVHSLFVYGGVGLFLLLAAVAVLSLRNWEQRRIQLLVLAGFLPFLLTGLYSLFTGGVGDGRFSISLHLLLPAFPFLFLLFGLSLAEVKWKWAALLGGLVLVLSLALIGLLSAYYSSGGWENLAAELRQVHENDVPVVHVRTESFYPVYYHNRQRLPEYHLAPEKNRGANEKQLLGWQEDEGLLIIFPENYNILRLNLIFSTSPEYVKSVSIAAGKFKLAYFPPE